MSALSKLLTLGSAAAGIMLAPAAHAQYYPGYTYPNGAGVAGQVLNEVIGGGYGYGANRQIAINQCASATQARLGAYGAGRVLGISEASPRADGGVTVKGVATSGQYAYGYGMQVQADLAWQCRTDFRGMVRDVNIGRSNYGYGTSASPWDDFSRFGYRRY